MVGARNGRMVMIAALLAAPMSIACGDKEAAPVTAAKQFAAAMQYGDEQTLLPLLDDEARARVDQLAAVAGDHVGGRRVVEPKEMLQIVDVPRTMEVARAELVSSTDEHAQVALIGADGSRMLVDLVLQDGTWRVRVPIPALGGDGSS